MAEEEYKEQVRQRIEAERKNLPDPDDKGTGEISSKFVRDCLYANELGDGILFASLHQGQFLYNKSASEWLRWEGNHWEIDIADEAVLASVENVSECYLTEVAKVGGQLSNATDKTEISNLESLRKLLYDRIKALRTIRRRKACCDFARSNRVNSMSALGEVFDVDPLVLGCANGVIDLQTGKLRPGRPGDYISKASPVEWHGINCPCPVWETTLMEILKNDESLCDFLARLFGYAITGLNIEHILPVFWGAKGRNGKGTIVETISAILGPLAAPAQSEMLLDQWRPKTASSASSDLMNLRGRRLVFASESDEGRHFSLSRVKWLTGGDTLTGRNPYDKYEISFTPTHTLFLLTNDRPSVKGDDSSFWERLLLVSFELTFVTREPIESHERPANRFLRRQLEKEYPGILAWLVRGTLRWQEQGLDPPPMVQQAAKAYRRNEDLVGLFIEECCYIDPRAETQAKDLYDVFTVWWEKNISKTPKKQRWFGQIMQRRFNKEKRGTIMYSGIGLLTDP